MQLISDERSHLSVTKNKKHHANGASSLMELPTGFEPMIIELQSIALPTWLRKQVLLIAL